jgi:hypothetical protein
MGAEGGPWIWGRKHAPPAAQVHACVAKLEFVRGKCRTTILQVPWIIWFQEMSRQKATQPRQARKTTVTRPSVSAVKRTARSHRTQRNTPCRRQNHHQSSLYMHGFRNSGWTAVRNVHVRTAYETYTDFVNLPLGAAEILSCVLSVLALACLVAVLRYFDGSVVTEMPLKISINTLVAVLAAVVKTSLLLPVAEGTLLRLAHLDIE